MSVRTDRKHASRAEKLVGLLLLTVLLLLWAFFLKKDLIPTFRLALREGNVPGVCPILLLEALHTLAVFVPAGLVPIAAGLSCPLPAVLLLCETGACLGASLLFVLVRAFGAHSAVCQVCLARFGRLPAPLRACGAEKLLSLLLLTPFVPFGAICLLGSDGRLCYGKYLRTVALGAIPSILACALFGRALRAALLRELSLWLLLLLLLLLAALLCTAIYLFLSRVCLSDYDETPDSPMYGLIFLIVRLWHGRRPRPVIEETRLCEARAPYVLLANHESFFDFYYIHQLSHPKNPSFLVNEFYCTRPVLKTMARHAGILSKKLFTQEFSSPIRILRTLKKGYPVVIFPEGRLSPDGRSNPIVEEGAAFFKRLNADLVLVKLRGAYFADPKWRKKRYRSAVSVTVEDVIRKETLRGMSDVDLNRRIAEALYNDANEELLCTYPQRDKARGLGDLLYRCVDCGALYTMRGEGNELVCSACGRRHTLDEHYRFTDAPFTVSGWYERIREMEKAELDALSLQTSVQTLIHGANGGKNRRETGVCSLTPEAFTYRSEQSEFSIPTEKLPALAYSCGEEFELYHEGELYYFYPAQQRQQAARWGLAVDLLAERRRAGVSCGENKGETI